jgi:hypothetical protein
MRGGQWQALRLCQGLIAHGIPAMLLARPDSELMAQAEDLGLLAQPLGALKVAQLSGEFDLVHAHDSRSHTLAAMCSRAPLVVSRRVAFEPRQRSVLSRWKYGRAARYLAISEYVRGQLITSGVPPERIGVVPDGVEAPAEVTYYEQRPEGRVVAAATTDPRKGGGLLRETGLAIRFSSNLPVDLAEARVFVYASEAEGLGSAALLAMSYGVPVVASRVGGLPEIVDHEKTGLLVENDPRAFAAAVGRLLQDPLWAAQLGEEGRRRVAERFTVERMVRATIHAYRHLLAERRSA